MPPAATERGRTTTPSPAVSQDTHVVVCACFAAPARCSPLLRPTRTRHKKLPECVPFPPLNAALTHYQKLQLRARWARRPEKGP